MGKQGWVTHRLQSLLDRTQTRNSGIFTALQFMHPHPHHAGHHHPLPHATDPAPKVQRLWSALVLIGGLSIAELAVGYWSHSLALLAESGHMISDGLAMGLALAAAWIAQRPHKHHDRWQKIETLAALMNGLGLVGIGVWIGWEAIVRLQAPPIEIASLPMLITAGLGFGINSLNVALLHQDSQDDLNLRGAFLHVLADAISSVGVIIAALAVATLHWLWADGVVSLFVAGLILLSAIPLLTESVKVLTEGKPLEDKSAQVRS